MLTAATARRASSWSALLMLVLTTVIVGYPMTTHASTPPEGFCWIYGEGGEVVDYKQCDENEGDEEEGGNDEGENEQGGEPTCDLTPENPWEPPYEYCVGEVACYDDPLPDGWLDAPGHEDIKAEVGPPPNDNSTLIQRWCRAPGAQPQPVFEWDCNCGIGAAPPPPSLEEQAIEAYGSLEVPDFSVAFSPLSNPAVGADTYFWVEFADPSQTGRIEGSNALTLFAVGVPDKMIIDPGDPEITSFECPWTVEETDDCLVNYLTPSVGGVTTDDDGLPSHLAEVTLVYSVHFQPVGGGAPLTIPGLDLDLYGSIEDTVTVPVPVEEIQALVTLL